MENEHIISCLIIITSSSSDGFSFLLLSSSSFCINFFLLFESSILCSFSCFACSSFDFTSAVVNTLALVYK